MAVPVKRVQGGTPFPIFAPFPEFSFSSPLQEVVGPLLQLLDPFSNIDIVLLINVIFTPFYTTFFEKAPPTYFTEIARTIKVLSV